ARGSHRGASGPRRSGDGRRARNGIDSSAHPGSERRRNDRRIHATDAENDERRHALDAGSTNAGERRADEHGDAAGVGGATPGRAACTDNAGPTPAAPPAPSRSRVMTTATM